MKTQLLCTFVPKRDVDEMVSTIVDNYTIENGKIYVYENLNNKHEYICTYNVSISDNMYYLDDTISVHRKRESNTLYTINALNSLVREANNGSMDKNFLLNWEQYKDMLLLSDKEGDVKRIKIKFNNLIKLVEKSNQ